MRCRSTLVVPSAAAGRGSVGRMTTPSPTRMMASMPHPQRRTTINYLICDAFSATFSENVTNVHCSPKHCDDFFNSSRFYDVFLFCHRCALKPKTLRRFVKFVATLRHIPFFRHKHCDDLFSLSRFYDVFILFVMDVHRWILKPKPSRRFVKFVAIQPTTP
jgi:hypothetical protein